jgi:hypothetical protein
MVFLREEREEREGEGGNRGITPPPLILKFTGS